MAGFAGWEVALIVTGVIVVVAALAQFLEREVERDYQGTVYTKDDPPTREERKRIVHDANRGG